MSLFTIRPGIEMDVSIENSDELYALPEEANIHALCAAIAADYVKFIKKNVLQNLVIPENYTIRDLQVLMGIFKSNISVTSANIVRDSGLDPATVARSVKALKKHGYVETQPSPKDSRSLLLTLTPKGRDLAKDYINASRAAFEHKGLGSTNMFSSEMGVISQLLRDFRNHSRKLRLD